MNIKVWIRITNNGDGSSSASLYPTREKAREGLDDDDFELDEDGNPGEYPVDID